MLPLQLRGAVPQADQEEDGTENNSEGRQPLDTGNHKSSLLGD